MKSDAKLIIEATDGNREAFGFLVDRYEKTFFHLAYLKTEDMKLSSEIIVNVFQTAFKFLRFMPERELFPQWLLHIFKKECKNLEINVDESQNINSIKIASLNMTELQYIMLSLRFTSSLTAHQIAATLARSHDFITKTFSDFYHDTFNLTKITAPEDPCFEARKLTPFSNDNDLGSPEKKSLLHNNDCQKCREYSNSVNKLESNLKSLFNPLDDVSGQKNTIMADLPVMEIKNYAFDSSLAQPTTKPLVNRSMKIKLIFVFFIMVFIAVLYFSFADLDIFNEPSDQAAKINLELLILHMKSPKLDYQINDPVQASLILANTGLKDVLLASKMSLYLEVYEIVGDEEIRIKPNTGSLNIDMRTLNMIPTSNSLLIAKNHKIEVNFNSYFSKYFNLSSKPGKYKLLGYGQCLNKDLSENTWSGIIKCAPVYINVLK